MAGIDRLPRSWWSFPSARSTYFARDRATLPTIERELDDKLDWLLNQPPLRGSLAVVQDSPTPSRTATAHGLNALIGAAPVRLPRPFEIFVSDPKPRARVRSCTACYLDLGDVLVSVPEQGWLIHFLSDQQWVMHWLLYLGQDGSEAVVATEEPFGFATDDAVRDRFDVTAGSSTVCADSFSEFLYRFWIENEIWFRRRISGSSELPITDEQRRYAERLPTDTASYEGK